MFGCLLVPDVARADQLLILAISSLLGNPYNKAYINLHNPNNCYGHDPPLLGNPYNLWVDDHPRLSTWFSIDMAMHKPPRRKTLQKGPNKETLVLLMKEIR